MVTKCESACRTKERLRIILVDLHEMLVGQVAHVLLVYKTQEWRTEAGDDDIWEVIADNLHEHFMTHSPSVQKLRWSERGVG